MCFVFGRRRQSDFYEAERQIGTLGRNALCWQASSGVGIRYATPWEVPELPAGMVFVT